MPQTEYTPTVSKLLEIGEPEWTNQTEKWLDYPKEYSLTEADIPQLIQLATEKTLVDNAASDASNAAAAAAPVHAWRALGQLQAEAAIEPLIGLLDTENDFVGEDIPLVYGLIGAKALPKLTEYLAKNNQSENILAGISAADAITEIGQRHPEATEAASAILVQQLENYQKNAPDFNGTLIAGLTQLKAASALPLIQQVFEADKVDIMHTDWDSVQFGFGLIDETEYKKREEANNAKRRVLQQQLFSSPPRQMLTPEGNVKTKPGSNKISASKKDKIKAKRKMEKTSRKINRKKK